MSKEWTSIGWYIKMSAKADRRANRGRQTFPCSIVFMKFMRCVLLDACLMPAQWNL